MMVTLMITMVIITKMMTKIQIMQMMMIKCDKLTS